MNKIVLSSGESFFTCLAYFAEFSYICSHFFFSIMWIRCPSWGFMFVINASSDGHKGTEIHQNYVIPAHYGLVLPVLRGKKHETLLSSFVIFSS